MMQKSPEAWLTRLNELVKTVRRQQGWLDVYASVQPPLQPDKPPLLRLEKAGLTDVVPLTLHAVKQMMLTGQENAMRIEIKQAFIRLVKSAERRSQVRSSRAQHRRPFF